MKRWESAWVLRFYLFTWLPKSVKKILVRKRGKSEDKKRRKKIHKYIFTSFYCIFFKPGLFCKHAICFFMTSIFVCCISIYTLAKWSYRVVFKSKCENIFTKQLTKWKFSDKNSSGCHDEGICDYLKRFLFILTLWVWLFLLWQNLSNLS